MGGHCLQDLVVRGVSRLPELPEGLERFPGRHLLGGPLGLSAAGSVHAAFEDDL